MAFSFKRFWKGINLVPKATTEADAQGDLEVLNTDGKLRYNNGVSTSPVVTESHSASLTNKIIDADNNTISNLEVDNLKTGVLNTDLSTGIPTDTEIPSALAVKTYVDSATGDVQADVDDLITLSGVPVNSTDLGTFTGIVIQDGRTIKGALQDLDTTATSQAGVIMDLSEEIQDLATLSGVPLDSTDLGTFTGNTIPDNSTIKGALQSLETSLEVVEASDATKVVGPVSSTDNHVVRFDGTTGKLVQDSLVTLSDTGAMSGLTGLVSSGNVVSTGAFSATGTMSEGVVTDSTTTGANATLTLPASPFVRLTNASLTSIDTITSPTMGLTVTIENATGNSITINNNNGATAANRILTGTKAPLTLADEASIIVKYDSTEQRWMVIGGTGAGGGQSLDTVFQLIGLDVPQWSTGNNANFLGGGTLAGTFVANTATPMHGISSYQYTQAAGSLNDYIASPAQDVALRFRGQTVTFYHPYTLSTGTLQLRIYDVTNSALIPVSATVETSAGVKVFKYNFVIPLTCTSIRVGYQVTALSSGSVFSFDDVQVTSDTTVYADISNAVRVIVKTYSSGSDWYEIFNDGWIRQGRRFPVTSGLTTSTLLVTMADTNYSIRLGLATDNGGGSTNNNISFRPSITTTSISAFMSTDFRKDYVVEGYASTSALIAIGVKLGPASNPNILTAPDTFNSETMPIVWSSTYTTSTLKDAPVGTLITWATAGSGSFTQATTRPTQTNDQFNTQGFLMRTAAYGATSGTAEPAYAAIQIGKGMKGVNVVAYKDLVRSAVSSSLQAADYVGSAGQFSTVSTYYHPDTGVLYLDFKGRSGVTNQPTIPYSDRSIDVFGYLVINASKNPALTGLNIDGINQFAYVSDVKASGTNGGTATATTWQARTLNTLVTDSGFISLAANTITLQPGKYVIQGGSMFSGANNQNSKVRLRNTSNNTTAVVGVTTLSNVATTYTAAYATMDGVFEISTQSTFQIQQYMAVAGSANVGLGLALSSGEVEVYSNYKIQKIR